MPVTQISFPFFAQSRVLALPAAPVRTPPIVAAHALAPVVAHGGDFGGECTSHYELEALYELLWRVRDFHGGLVDPSLPLDSRGSNVLLLRYFASGGCTGFVSNSDRVHFYDELCDAAARCIGEGC